jgi:uncharacterized protein
MTTAAARYPFPAPIDAYGNGGFRFAGMSHRGSILCLPTGIHAWPVTTIDALTEADIAPALAERQGFDLLLFGTGRDVVLLPEAVKKALGACDLWHETMSTGAAARTYNVLLGEGRTVGAALIAIE